MMSKKKPNRFQIENSTLDNLVPKEHLVNTTEVFVDSTHIKAAANKEKYDKVT